MKLLLLGEMPAAGMWVPALGAYDVRLHTALWYTKGSENAATVKAELRLGDGYSYTELDVAGLNVGETRVLWLALMMKYTQLDPTKTTKIGIDVMYTRSEQQVTLDVSKPTAIICKNCSQVIFDVGVDQSFTYLARNVAILLHPVGTVRVTLVPGEGGMDYATVEYTPPDGRDTATLTVTELDANGNVIDQASVDIPVYYVEIRYQIAAILYGTSGFHAVG